MSARSSSPSRGLEQKMHSSDFSPFRYFSRQGAHSRWLANEPGILRCDPASLASGLALCFNSASHSCIQRGGGTGPLKPRQPFRARARETVPIPAGSKYKPGRCDGCSSAEPLSLSRTEVFFVDKETRCRLKH